MTRNLLLGLVVLVLMASSAGADSAAEDALRVYGAVLDGRAVLLYVMWGENPHQSWPIHYVQNPHEAHALRDGAFQVRGYMAEHPADWVFCLLEIPEEPRRWQLCHASFELAYEHWYYTFGLIGSYEEQTICSIDYVFADCPAQFAVIPGYGQRVGFPNIAIGRTTQGRVGRNLKNRIPVWVAFPQGSLEMRSRDEYTMTFNLPSRVKIINGCGDEGTWLETHEEGR